MINGAALDKRAGTLTPAPAPGQPDADVPRISATALRWFRLYILWYLSRHFHAVRVSRNGLALASLEGWPVVVCMNHPAWWDPLLALLLSWRCFPERSHYGPIEAAAVARYGFFQKLGFYGIEPGTARGAARFLRISRAILREPHRAIWITAQGRFVDPRQRPAGLQPGLGHLARHLERCAVVPLALEYPYWEERTPEGLARFGEPVFITNGRERTAEEWTALFAARLAETQDALAAEAIRRRPEEFEIQLRGLAGVGGIYDLWRAARAWARGQRFHAEHGREG